MIPSQLQPLANHLWQSTLFAAVAGLLTLALRMNRAQTRYWLWLAASVKFLIPFSLLVDVGSHWGRHTAPTITLPVLSYVMERANQPFSLPAPLATATAAPANSFVNWVPAVLSTVWAIGFATLIWSWWRRWRGLRTALRTAWPIDLQIGMEAKMSSAFAEPGVFGVRRPTLLLPAGISDRLTPPQLKAIVAHELCHIRRRDNLATAIHMGVEALFWFYPLVWWLGARLMEERERACDEEVLLTGSEPQAYAEGILKICELYLESPLPCVSGVTGANLRKRIEEIMSNRIGIRLSFAKKAVLTVAGVFAVAAPTIVGMMGAPPSRAQTASAPTPKFEVASIKPHKMISNEVHRTVDVFPGGRLVGHDATLQQLIQHAYDVRYFQITGGPGWVSSDGYDVEAKAAGNASREQIRLKLRTLLEDRFNLRLHGETKRMGAYELTVAKSGARLPPAKAGGCVVPDTNMPVEPGQASLPPCGRAWLKGDRSLVEIAGFGLAMSDFTKALSNALNGIVFDKTGITQRFDVRLEFSPEGLSMGKGVVPESPPSDSANASLSSALERQLGLKLESAKDPVEILVIDHVEKPSAN
jgi:uncharacterized protein (TIGR03435 family)